MSGGFIGAPRKRGGGKVPFTEAELTAIRGGLSDEEHRWQLIRSSGEFR